MKSSLLVIVGPTGIGKTDIAIELARRLDGEIVNADSRQIYRSMDIGTAKPTQEQLAAVPHHLVSIVEPDYVMTLAEIKARMCQAIDEIDMKGKIPLLVGGTGQYIMAIVENWSIPKVAPDPRIRTDLETYAQRFGQLSLYEYLLSVDPISASKQDFRNTRRVIRALEVYVSTGSKISDLQHRQEPLHNLCVIGLTCDRGMLSARNDQRIDSMISNGLVTEVQALVDSGYDVVTCPSMTSIGYQEISLYVRGQTDLESAIFAFRKNTREFVRRQYTWFKPDDPRITWYDVGQLGYAEIIKSITEEFSRHQGRFI
jgi:tRNA dimethylallyltransferase